MAAISIKDWLTDPARWSAIISDLALDGIVDDEGARSVLHSIMTACQAALT